jgi:glyoxylase-like metal-dependent hydrolase (beta-lactamase superfamily II)
MRGTTLSRWNDVNHRSGWLIEVTPDVFCIQSYIVNCFTVGRPGGPWVLVDTGIPQGRGRILQAARQLYGPDARPEAILLTHGHFDHVGPIEDLLAMSDVPVYAHHMELPFLTGQSDYPPPDPTVGGGALARSAKLFPRSAIDLGPRVHELPPDKSVPSLPGWTWIHTPGHTPGHVSFYRHEDGLLLAGDAFITTKQESLFSVMTQQKVIHGPPAYFTIDWDAARASVQELARWEPRIAATGHGIPMGGDRLKHDLWYLAQNFDEIAVPKKGRYVREPARWNDDGAITYVPPPVFDPTPWLAAGIGAAVLLGVGAAAKRRDKGWLD